MNFYLQCKIVLWIPSKEKIRIGKKSETRLVPGGNSEITIISRTQINVRNEIRLGECKKFRNKVVPDTIRDSFSVQTLFSSDFYVERNFDYCFHNKRNLNSKYMKRKSFPKLHMNSSGFSMNQSIPGLTNLGKELDRNQICVC